METAKSAVFSPCTDLDSASMIKCLQALLKNFPSIKFDSIISDIEYGGFKVYFSEPDESEVLQSNELFLEEPEPVWIYPLTTYLIIENLDHMKIPCLKPKLRAAIKENFGKVIDIDKPDQSKSYFIEIDIPEFKNLKAFKHLTEYILPIKDINEKVTLKQWCRQCKVSGHFQHECSKRLGKMKNEISEMEKKGTSASKEKVGENFKESTTSSPEQNYENRPKKFFNISLKTDRYAEEIGRNEVMSSSKKKQKANNTKADTGGNINNNLLIERSCKEEIKDVPQNINQKIDIDRRSEYSQFSENDCHTKSKLNEEISYNSGDFSSSDEDDISIIEDTSTSTSNKFQVQGLNSSRVKVSHFDEESRSSDTKNKYSSNVSSSNPGPSNQSNEPPPSQATKPSRGIKMTCLSKRLEDCINQVCENGVFDREELDAFLIHVKKKPYPIRVADNYTKNTEGLKEQLQAILDMHYKTPETGTKKDIQFIKWLKKLVERFDGPIPKNKKKR